MRYCSGGGAGNPRPRGGRGCRAPGGTRHCRSGGAALPGPLREAPSWRESSVTSQAPPDRTGDAAHREPLAQSPAVEGPGRESLPPALHGRDLDYPADEALTGPPRIRFRRAVSLRADPRPVVLLGDVEDAMDDQPCPTFGFARGASLQRFRRQDDEFLEPGVTIDFRFMPRIEPGPTGRHRFTISNSAAADWGMHEPVARYSRSHQLPAIRMALQKSR